MLRERLVGGQRGDDAHAGGDAAGVTAAFNLNLAARINRELEGTIPLDALRHRIVWNDELSRIEMHLEATRDIAFTVCGKAFVMRGGETIHTENSHKYDVRSATQLLLAGRWQPCARYMDGENRFMVMLELGYPSPDPTIARLVNGLLRLRGRLTGGLPERTRPHLRTKARRRAYPRGYEIATLGPE